MARVRKATTGVSVPQRVECRKPLPPANTFAVFMSNGRSHNAIRTVCDPASAAQDSWDSMTLIDGDDESRRVEITTVSRNPVTMQVWSSERKLTQTIALYLAMETEGKFVESGNGDTVDQAGQ